MKKVFLALLAVLAFAVPAAAIQQFQSDSTHEMGIDSNSNIFLRDPNQTTVTLSQIVTRGPLVASAYQPTNTSVSSATVIPASGFTYETLVSSGGNLQMSGLPTIATTTIVGAGLGVGGATALTDGTFLILSSTSTQTFTLQDNGTLSGSLLLLGASTRIIGNHKTIGLILNAGLGKWTEVFYANNN